MKGTLALFTFIFLGFQNGRAQSEPGMDCTVSYNLSVEDTKADVKVKQSMSGATKVVYIKGTKTRSDLLTAGFRQTTFFNSKSDSVIVLKEFGTAKYITYLTGEKRKERNKKSYEAAFKETGEKKVILGYDCKKIVATKIDGTTYEAFYTPLISPLNNQFEPQFKDIPGFVLEYESVENNKTKIKYTASKISFLPVPAAKFDIPSAGYRIL